MASASLDYSDATASAAGGFAAPAAGHGGGSNETISTISESAAQLVAQSPARMASMPSAEQEAAMQRNLEEVLAFDAGGASNSGLLCGSADTNLSRVTGTTDTSFVVVPAEPVPIQNAAGRIPTSLGSPGAPFRKTQRTPSPTFNIPTFTMSEEANDSDVASIASGARLITPKPSFGSSQQRAPFSLSAAPIAWEAAQPVSFAPPAPRSTAANSGVSTPASKREMAMALMTNRETDFYCG